MNGSNRCIADVDRKSLSGGSGSKPVRQLDRLYGGRPRTEVDNPLRAESYFGWGVRLRDQLPSHRNTFSFGDAHEGRFSSRSELPNCGAPNHWIAYRAKAAQKLRCASFRGLETCPWRAYRITVRTAIGAISPTESARRQCTVNSCGL